jgi:transporter family-2 protein
MQNKVTPDEVLPHSRLKSGKAKACAISRRQDKYNPYKEPIMTAKIVFLGIALISGAAMAVQGTFNSVLSRFTGLLGASFVVHLTGTVLIFLLLFVLHLGQGDLTAVTTAPWYTLLGGVLNVIIIYGVALAISNTGVANATTAIIVGQVLFALIIDHLGLFGAHRIACSWPQLVGLALLAAGAKLLLR